MRQTWYSSRWSWYKRRCNLHWTPSRCRSPGHSAEVTEVRTVRSSGSTWQWTWCSYTASHLEAAHNCGRQRGVVLRAQHSGVHQHESAKQQVVTDFVPRGKGKKKKLNQHWGQSAIVYCPQWPISALSKETRCFAGWLVWRPVFLPHDAREDELAEEKHIGPAFIVDCLGRGRERGRGEFNGKCKLDEEMASSK